MAKDLRSLMPEVIATLRAEGRSVSLVDRLEAAMSTAAPESSQQASAEYELHTQGASHKLVDAYDGRDPDRNRAPKSTVVVTADFEQCDGYPAFAAVAAPQAAQGDLPERNSARPAEMQGLFRKFDVRRTDGSDRQGGKHRGCRYFVLDVDHDAHAQFALTAYATACEATHPLLAQDLREKWGAAPPVHYALSELNARLNCLKQRLPSDDSVARQFFDDVASYARAALSTPPMPSFQDRVQPWMMECFGPEISADRTERNHRFFEEATELVQSLGMTASEAHQLVDYVFGRPAGEPNQEAGGVMVTLAALCLARGLNMHKAGETELARISVPETVAKIRAKQAAKPKHSPLPEVSTPPMEGNAACLSDLVESEKQRLVDYVADTWPMGKKYGLLEIEARLREAVHATATKSRAAIVAMGKGGEQS